ncbi:MAG: hypothetical protein U0235_13840 [Polyangiaceae bacterium]
MSTSARRRPRLALAGGSGGGDVPPSLSRALALLALDRTALRDLIRAELAREDTDGDTLPAPVTASRTR